MCYRLTHIKFPGSKKHVGYVKSRCKTTWQTDVVKFSSIVILVTKRFPFPVLTQFSDFFFKSSIQFHEYVSLIDQKDSETKLLRRRSKFHQECMYLPTYVQFHGLVKTSSHHCAIREKNFKMIIYSKKLTGRQLMVKTGKMMFNILDNIPLNCGWQNT